MQHTALITGGNRGIGLEIVKGLARYEHRVLLGSRDLEKGRQTAEHLTGNITPVALNLSDETILQKQLNALSQQYGHIDVLVNNAAVMFPGEFLDTPSESFMCTMQVNMLSVFTLTKHFTPAMVEKGYGRIVNMSSDYGSFHKGLTGPAAYSISKAALNALTVTLARQLTSDVKVNAVCPGCVRTDMGTPDSTYSPEEGAAPALWLATLPSDGPNGCFFQRWQPMEW